MYASDVNKAFSSAAAEGEEAVAEREKAVAEGAEVAAEKAAQQESQDYEALRAWFEAHKDEIFANDTVGTGCFSYQPGEVVLAVTKRCNLWCKHCSISDFPEEELSTEECKAVIEDAAKIGKVKFAFTGGEPLLREDIYELIEYAASFDMQVVMATNGTLITEDVAKKLKKAGLERAAISIDGIGSFHDEFRGVEGAFARTLRGIRSCKKVGLAFQLFTTVSRLNYGEIPKIIRMASRLNAFRIYLIYLIAVGRGRKISDACLSAEQNLQFFEFLLRTQPKTKVWLKPICNPQFWAFLRERNIVDDALCEKFVGCTAGITRFHIFPNGDVAPCAYLPLKVGNVKDARFLEIARNAKEFRELRARNVKGRCSECKYREICGGCRSRAFAVKGDFLAEDPVCPLHINSTER